MPAAVARVATDRPAPYLKQLCRHFGHKVEASFDDEQGSIAFAMGTVALDAREPGVLVLHAEGGGPEELERLTQVVGSHLERFGRRDELAVRWDAVAPA